VSQTSTDKASKPFYSTTRFMYLYFASLIVVEISVVVIIFVYMLYLVHGTPPDEGDNPGIGLFCIFYEMMLVPIGLVIAVPVAYLANRFIIE